MTNLRKNLRRQIRDTCNRMRRRKLLIFTICLGLFIWKIYMQYSLPVSPKHSACEPIDVVYTWVNGSDPDFVASVQRFDTAIDPARFDDKHELRYSLRSLELHAPWVRHVYIVTNGQIPHWLDLSYERVTIVPHDTLAPSPEILPTFSSAAIETFLHRIPGLSKRFLYMNDDIFLGAPLYPEDLHTAADGVRIYHAWTVPDCAVDCPWVYIGDGLCDSHCNIVECQFDGGDCVLDGIPHSRESSLDHEEEHDRLQEHQENKTQHKKRIRKEIDAKNASKTIDQPFQRSSFREVLKHKNLTTVQELQRIVHSFNNRHKYMKNSPPQFSSTTSRPAVAESPRRPSVAESPRLSNSTTFKSSKDIYSQSLIHTNMLLNRHYGFKARNVLAHVGFLLDRDIVTEMQAKFHEEFKTTASNRFRSAEDLQFAFMFYSYVMGETYNASVADIFDEFDTDSSLTWSDREVRTFLARMYPLPLDWSAVRYFEEVIENCSRNSGYDRSEQGVVYTTLVYERYEDSNVPTITRNLVEQCELLAEALLMNFATRPKYKFHLNSKRGMHSNFMMLTSNVSEVIEGLDRMRRTPKKFNCINDNLEPQFHEENDLIRHLLEDFYLSFFPRRSRFELDERYRNRFTSWNDYQSWRLRKAITLFIGYGASAVLVIFLLRFVCWHKAKFVRRYVQKL